MHKPLENIRVVELGAVITGPLAANLLGELGAEVIKVENPNGGDPFRSFLGGLYSPHFRAYNKNKKSIALDLSQPENQDKLKAVLETADVMIDNFRPGVLDRLGLGEAVLTKLNPRLIRCSITGFGSSGPYSRRPAYDAVAQAISGIAGLFLDKARPRLAGPTISDNVTGMYAALGVLAALHERNRTNMGRRVEVSMIESSVAFIPDQFAFDEAGMEITPFTRVAASQSYAVFCADGKPLALHLSSLPKFWESLLKAIERPDLLEDPRFVTRPDRFRNYEELQDILSEVFATRPRGEWVERLQEVEVPFAPVNDISEIPDDPQIRHLETFYRMAASDGTMVRSTHCPIWFDGARAEPQSAPPLLGEHNELYLGETRKEADGTKNQP
ncbi:MAG: CoA transferase [Pseudomonadota bacterium]|nr:CoA transferase [Pseudomonadota bacterium]MEE2859672.1 CoA transferase [Pseudomonadota bacterium]